MFLFEPIPWQSALMFLAVLGGLMAVNEITRRSKIASFAVYLALPIVMTVAVWPATSGSGTATAYWFPWVKTYSALAGTLGFMALRYSKKLQTKKLMLAFPAFILAVNILEAVVRDFQCVSLSGVVDGVFIMGGPWNVLNGIAGLLNIVTISGWMGIFVSKDKSRDMIWPDQIWPWIISYDLWNFAYVYNCMPDRSFYTGLALLLSCTIPAFLFKRGAWLQHRAQTLSLWCMFSLTFPWFSGTSAFAVKSSHSPTAFWAVSLLALASNAALFVWQFSKAFRGRKNLLGGEIHGNLRAYSTVVAENR